MLETKFKNTEIGPIPVDWEVRTLGEIANLYQPPTILQQQFTQTGYNVYGANGIIGKYKDYNHALSQIVVACRGSSCGSVNQTYPYSWINGNAMVVNIEKNKDINQSYLYQTLNILDFTDTITGSGQPQITRFSIKKLLLSMPPLAEQEAIGVALREVDELIEGLKKLVAKKRAIKQGAMSQLLSGKIRLV